jgi:hypothetical protein
MRQRASDSNLSRLWLMASVVTSIMTLACGFVGAAFNPTPTSSAPAATLPPIAGTVAPVLAGTPTVAPTEQPVGPVEQIILTAPLPGQGVRGNIQVEGVSDPTFEQQLGVLIRDAKGNVVGSASAKIQADVGQRGRFSVGVPLSAVLPPQLGRVIVYALSARDGGLVHLSSVNVQLNSDAAPAVSQIDPYQREAIVITDPSNGATLRGSVKVMAEVYYVSNLVVEVRGSNNQTVGRVTRQLTATESLPALLSVDVPLQVTAAQPGRIVVYALNTNDAKTEHLGSIEVNLQP